MSFAYAKRFGSRVYIFADTRVSQNGIKLPPDKGVLKTTFLSPQAAISFCQSPDLAARDIDEFSERFGDSLNMLMRWRSLKIPRARRTMTTFSCF